MNNKLKIGLIIITSGFLLISGCSKKNVDPIPSKYKGKSENVVYTNKEKVKVDKKLTASIKKEIDVLDGTVYTQGTNVVATMILKDNIKKNSYNKVADKYLKILKKNYKDKNINVQAVHKGKNVVNMSYNQ